MLAKAAIQPGAPSFSATVQSQLFAIVLFIMQHDENMGNVLAATGIYKAFHYYKA